MGIYRGAGGTGDAVNDASSEALLTVQARDAAVAAKNAAEAAQVAAETAETNAETAETNAATSAANALTSENNASSSKDVAEAWATQLSTPVSGSSYSAKYNANLAAASAVTAGGYASDANSYKLSAAASASTATTQAGIASGHASAAATSEANAATSEANAATSESNAATSAANAAASYDNFDDRYLGPKSSNPTVDNDGNALLTGALYFNTVVPEMRVYNGSSWNFIGSGGGAGVESFNTRTGAVTLTSSDVTTALAYTPLAPSAIGSTVQAYDAQLADIAGLTPTDNSFIVGNGTNFVAEGASTARTSLGLGTAATTAATDYATAAQGTKADTAYTDRLKWDGGSTGLVADTGRTSLGLGTAATTASTDYATAAQGTKADNALTAANPSYTGTLTGGTGVVNLGSGQVYKDASGNVGIGTASPDDKLTVSAGVTVGSEVASGYAVLSFKNSGTGSASYASIRKNYDSPFDLRIRASNASGTAGPLVFETSSGSEAMRIETDNSVSINSTGTISIPSGTTAQRPASPVAGALRFNTSVKLTEIYTGTAWEAVGDQFANYSADFVVVAGGGGGGTATSGSARSGAGGGAGGFRTSAGTSGGGAAAETPLTLTKGTVYTITIGAGGSGSSGTSGSNSVFSTITSTGGGRGGTSGTSPLSGGSGGGGGSGAGFTTGGSGTSGQGFAGGNGESASVYRGGGGGGASAVGVNGASPPNGGAGVATTISGSSVTYAGGGGGGGNSLPAVAGSGGTGGGGGGGASAAGTAGTTNTGGGGGGAYGGVNANGGNGGSGIVVVRIPTNAYSGVTTGTPAVTTSGLNTILTYTSSGTYTA